ncbi:type II toxin-antitoxin system RelE/ParE family toxin [Streptomyces sp. DSM 44915]|uniref:Type II toxin-antitoxin system RelE/ParE family toxin n=1 Tax=Streptomyces chisholmiae TaxID=3075540 RepID=A0ABU2JL77_9ACTN|nr:type II toxin-antitoxin system RelE/ParE family toxin [Streptomyces sp. DSM 44915]MDT0265715.1 type II toxin-antitoxin system RelE/ParE family toxin [Streptomyces sp. DSM 44915]
MTYEIEFEPAAVNAAARFLKDDPIGLKALLDAIDALAGEPRPVHSSVFGDYRRLRVGGYRVLYAVEDGAVRILVVHLGRVG